mmetsp:Transcript_88435/g.286361  ORF Transcript_88435/g.286361 Transcript_88435/m.286361 type:complete len:127 (+) Transcript_88435:53-433(+)
MVELAHQLLQCRCRHLALLFVGCASHTAWACLTPLSCVDAIEPGTPRPCAIEADSVLALVQTQLDITLAPHGKGNETHAALQKVVSREASIKQPNVANLKASGKDRLPSFPQARWFDSGSRSQPPW